MARAYDNVKAPGGKGTIAAGVNQAARPGARVLVNGGFITEVTNRDKISLIHQPLWTDASYTNSGAIWLGGGTAQPATVGGSIPYGVHAAPEGDEAPVEKPAKAAKA